MTIEEQLIRHEGLELRAYVDTVGKVTIGVGRNLTDVGISRAEALTLLQNDLATVDRGLSQQAPWFVTLDSVRRKVLVDMAFNLGVAGLLKFTRTLAAVQAGRYDEAATLMLQSKWARQVKARAVTLAAMMRSGVDL